MPDRLEGAFRTPNNPLKPWEITRIRLTRRAALSGMLVWAAGLPHNPAVSARFHRAASLEAVMCRRPPERQ
jgi:hypothetical protein